MNIMFYQNFRKRINSTKRPSGNGELSLEGTLRDGCSMENPVIGIKNMGNQAPAQYNYAIIGKFGRWYFVDDWTYEQGLWYAHLREDYLATWKNHIGTLEAYIDRCASTFNGNIIDTTYITGTNFINHHVDMGNEFYNYNLSSGCFVLGIIDSNANTDSQVGGAVCYYVLSPAQCRSLMNYLLGDNFLTQNGFPSVQTLAQDMSQAMAKAFIKPMDFIVSCMWYPLPVAYLASGSDIGITVGYWHIETNIATGKLLNQGTYRSLVTGELPDHPQAQTRGNYLNFSPYTRISLEIPPFGNIPIDTSFRTLGKYIISAIYIDPITGTSVLHVHMSDVNPSTPEALNSILNGSIVYETSGQVGVPIQLAQVNGDYVNFASEAVQAVSSVDLIGGAVGMALGGPMGAIKGAINKDVITHTANALTSLAPLVRGTGSNGSRLITTIKPRISIQWMPLVAEDNEELGRPLREKRVINTLSGFIKCFEVSVDIPCFESEKSVVHEHLLNGFFWE